MIYLPPLFMTLTIVVLCIMLPRMYGDWLKVDACLESGDTEELQICQQLADGWVTRHFGCALVLVLLIILLDRSFAPAGAHQLRGVLCIYATISLFLALAESLLSQKIATLAIARMRPVRVKSRREE